MSRLSCSMVSLSLTLLAACNGGGTVLPAAECPVITAPPPDFGPVAQQASTESVAIVLTQLYMRARVQSQMEQTLPATATQQQLAIPEGQPGHIPKGGIRLNSVNLEQRGQDASRVNLIAIGMSPWLRSDTAEASDPSGNTRRLTQSVIPRNFILRLRLIPHLITADTEMSLAKRQTLLGCAPPDTTCAGILLSLGFFELYDQGFGEQVVCNGGRGGVPQRSPNYDFVAAQVLQGALDTVNGKVIPASGPGGQPTVIPPLRRSPFRRRPSCRWSAASRAARPSSWLE